MVPASLAVQKSMSAKSPSPNAPAPTTLSKSQMELILKTIIFLGVCGIGTLIILAIPQVSILSWKVSFAGSLGLGAIVFIASTYLHHSKKPLLPPSLLNSGNPLAGHFKRRSDERKPSASRDGLPPLHPISPTSSRSPRSSRRSVMPSASVSSPAFDSTEKNPFPASASSSSLNSIENNALSISSLPETIRLGCGKEIEDLPEMTVEDNFFFQPELMKDNVMRYDFAESERGIAIRFILESKDKKTSQDIKWMGVVKIYKNLRKSDKDWIVRVNPHLRNLEIKQSAVTVKTIPQEFLFYLFGDLKNIKYETVYHLLKGDDLITHLEKDKKELLKAKPEREDSLVQSLLQLGCTLTSWQRCQESNLLEFLKDVQSLKLG